MFTVGGVGQAGLYVLRRQVVAHCTGCFLQRADTVVVVRDVPAEVCENCGEYYLSEPTAMRVYADADETARRQVEVETQRYAARCIASVETISASP